MPDVEFRIRPYAPARGGRPGCSPRCETPASSSCWRGCRSRSACLPARAAAPRRAGRPERRSRRRDRRVRAGPAGRPQGDLPAVRADLDLRPRAAVRERGVRGAHPAGGADLVRTLRPVGPPLQGGARLPADSLSAARLPGAPGRTPLAADREPRPDELPPDRPQPGHYEWLRHRVEPWLPTHAGAHDGLFSVRSVDIDEEADGLQDAVEWLNGHTKDTDPTADLVLGDLVVPFLGPFWLPVPRHLTAGIRRKVLDPGNKSEVFAFERAPVHLPSPTTSCRVQRRVALLPLAARRRHRRGPRADLQRRLVFGRTRRPSTRSRSAWRRTTRSSSATSVTSRARKRHAGARRQARRRRSTRSCTGRSRGAVILDIMGFRLGLSLGRKLAGKSWADSTLATADIFVSMPPTGSDRSVFRLRALNGEKVAFTLEGFGWRLGSSTRKASRCRTGSSHTSLKFALVISRGRAAGGGGCDLLLLLRRPADRAAERARGRRDRQAAALPRRRRRDAPGREDGRLLPLRAQQRRQRRARGRRLLHGAGEPRASARASSASPGTIGWKAGTKHYRLGARPPGRRAQRPEGRVRLLHDPGLLPGDDRPARRLGVHRRALPVRAQHGAEAQRRSTSSRATSATTAGTRSRTTR